MNYEFNNKGYLSDLYINNVDNICGARARVKLG